MGRGGRWKDHRLVINGILFRQRTGIPWRDLPARFGKRKTCHARHRRWSADGTWEKVLRAVQADADAEGRIDWSVVSVDSMVCRVHQQAAGARHRPARIPGRRRSPAWHRDDEAIGRSRGGLTTEDPPGERRRLPTTGCPDHTGQWGDAPQLIPVLDRIRVPQPAGGHPGHARTTSAGTRRTAPAGTGATCGDGRSGTPSPSAETSRPTADAVAARVADPPASTGTGTHAGTKSSAL
ncbi:IS5 family transposase [Streptomyces inhibens]|uniref:IS5 family transposase n=1 Tax=Streptomyces inhibens TaxID=2293571 RepID=UPI003CCA40C1